MTKTKVGSIRAWMIWLIAALFYLYEFTQRISPSSMIPELMRDFNIAASEVGFFSAVYFYAYAAFQIPAGLLADRLSIRKMLTIASLTVALGSFCQMTATTLLSAYLARGLIGMGSAFAFVGCLKIGVSWFEGRWIPLLVGLTNIFGVLGATVAGRPLAMAIDAIGWRSAFGYLTAIGLLITLLIFLFVRSGPNIASPNPVDELADKSLCSYRPILTSPSMWALVFYAALLVAPLEAFAELWGVHYLMESYHFDRPAATGYNSLIFLGIALGSPLVGLIATACRFNLKRLMAGGTMLTFCCLSAIIYIQNIPVPLLMVLLFAYGLLTTNMLLCFSMASLTFSARQNGLVIGLINTFIMALGACYQHGTGILLDMSSHASISVTNYQVVFLLLPLSFVIALFLLPAIKVPASLKYVRGS